MTLTTTTTALPKYHGLLPLQLQNQLMHAGQSGRADSIDAAIADCIAKVPECFHNVDSLSDRVFFDQPARPLPMAFSIHPLTRSVS
jgi:hypothetical protein